jgi:hypothetical protein
MKIRPLGAELFLADGRTGRHDETNSYFFAHPVYVIQRDTQCFRINFIHNTCCLNMFRSSTVHLQERFSSSCMLRILVHCILRSFSISGFGGLEAACWAFRTPSSRVQTRPKPVGFFRAKKKSPARLFVRNGSKDVGPMS